MAMAMEAAEQLAGDAQPQSAQCAPLLRGVVAPYGDALMD